MKVDRKGLLVPTSMIVGIFLVGSLVFGEMQYFWEGMFVAGVILLYCLACYIRNIP